MTFDNFSNKSSGEKKKILLYTFSSEHLTYLQLLESQARDLLRSVETADPNILLESDLIDSSDPIDVQIEVMNDQLDTAFRYGF